MHIRAICTRVALLWISNSSGTALLLCQGPRPRKSLSTSWNSQLVWKICKEMSVGEKCLWRQKEWKCVRKSRCTRGPCTCSHGNSVNTLVCCSVFTQQWTLCVVEIAKKIKACVTQMKESWHTSLSHGTCMDYSRYIWYGVATISGLLKIIGLFCKRAL